LVNEPFQGAAEQTKRWCSNRSYKDTPAMTDERPAPYPAQYEDQRKDSPQGQPPRPASEPEGSQGSSNSGETATDPATGEPND
jgi:hypothetical protein